MKKYFTIVILVFAFTSIYAQDWQVSNTFNPGQTIQDVLTLDENTTYAVSSLFNGSGLNIKRTIDNGDNWTEENTNNAEPNFRSLASPDGVTVFAVGNDGNLITNSGTATWSTIDLGTTLVLRDIFFVNETIGFIAADDATIFKTLDGGATWEDIAPNISGVGTIANIYFLDENKGFICGFNYMQVTNDGGDNWEYVPQFEPQPGELFQLNEIQFLDESIGYVCGDVGAMFKTIDGGLTWEPQVTNTTESLQDLKFLSEEIGFVCGFNATILETADGGDSWNPMTAAISENFRAIDFNSEKGFMASQSGTILTLDDVPVILNNTAFEGNNPIQIFPNPANEVVSIQSQDNQLIESILLIDALGNVLNEIFVSNNKVDLVTSNLASGVYILRIKTPSEAAYNKRLVKQ